MFLELKTYERESQFQKELCKQLGYCYNCYYEHKKAYFLFLKTYTVFFSAI